MGKWICSDRGIRENGMCSYRGIGGRRICIGDSGRKRICTKRGIWSGGICSGREDWGGFVLAGGTVSSWQKLLPRKLTHRYTHAGMPLMVCLGWPESALSRELPADGFL